MDGVHGSFHGGVAFDFHGNWLLYKICASVEVDNYVLLVSTFDVAGSKAVQSASVEHWEESEVP